MNRGRPAGRPATLQDPNQPMRSRKPRSPLLRTLLGVVLLLLLVLGGAGWWLARSWAPDRKAFATQGLWVTGAEGPIDWKVVHATGPGGRGADFVYLTASTGARERNTAFVDDMEAARAAHLQVGAVHLYDVCAKADGQGANFVTTVPRDRALLPPAILLDLDKRECPNPPGEAVVESELTTFLNQVEKHLGKPVVLMITRDFESRYHLAATVDRNLWVAQDYWAPTYVARPWVLWTATDTLRIAGAAGPVHWVVVQP